MSNLDFGYMIVYVHLVRFLESALPFPNLSPDCISSKNQNLSGPHFNPGLLVLPTLIWSCDTIPCPPPAYGGCSGPLVLLYSQRIKLNSQRELISEYGPACQSGLGAPSLKFPDLQMTWGIKPDPPKKRASLTRDIQISIFFISSRHG